MKYFILELVRFIRINSKKIIFSTVILSVLLFGANFFINRTSPTDSFQTNKDINTEEKKEEVQDYSPAIFQFYIENDQDGTSYTNNWILEQYLLRSEILKSASKSTKTELFKKVEMTDNTAENVDENGDKLQIIGIIRDGNSHLQTLYVNYNTDQENLKIAQYFQKFLSEDNVSFLQNKNFYIFSDSHIIDNTNSNSNSTSTSLPDLEETVIEQQWVEKLAEISIIIIVSFIISILIITLTSYFSKKLTVSLFYKILDKDYFIIADKRFDFTNEVTDVLASPAGAKKVVLQETNEIFTNKIFEKILEENRKNETVQILNNFVSVENPEKIDRLIFIVKEGITTREWYVKQRRYAESFNIPTVVIQVNKITTV